MTRPPSSVLGLLVIVSSVPLAPAVRMNSIPMSSPNSDFIFSEMMCGNMRAVFFVCSLLTAAT